MRYFMDISGYIMSKSLDKLHSSKINSILLLVIWGSLYLLSTSITLQFNSQLPEYVTTTLSWLSLASSIIALFYALRLFRINQIEVKNPKIAKQLYDEQEKVIRAKSAANGFITCIITYCAFITIGVVMKVLFENNSFNQLNGMFIGGLMLIAGYLASVISYKKLHQE